MIDSLQSQILQNVPVAIKLGRVHAPDFECAEVTTDREGRLTNDAGDAVAPTSKASSPRRLLRSSASDLADAHQAPPEVMGSIAGEIKRAQQRLPLNVKLQALVASAFEGRRPMYWFVGIGVALVQLGFLISYKQEAASEPEATVASAQPVERASDSSPFGEPRPVQLAPTSGESTQPGEAESPVALPQTDAGPLPPALQQQLLPLAKLPKPRDEPPLPSATQQGTPASLSARGVIAVGKSPDEKRDPMIALREDEVLPAAAPTPAKQSEPSPLTKAASRPTGSAQVQASPTKGVDVAAIKPGSDTPAQASAASKPQQAGAVGEVTWRYGHLGIATLTAEGAVIAARGEPQRVVRPGEKLPDGSVLTAVDPKKSRLVTDKATVTLQ